MDEFDEALSVMTVSLSGDENVEAIEIVEEVEVRATYTPNQLANLVTFVQRMTILYALDPEDWTSACIQTIEKWFLEPEELMLTIFYEGTRLCAALTFPLAPVFDLVYFLREPNQIFTVDGFQDEILFGTVQEEVDLTLLNVLEKVYAPIFFQTTDYKENVKGQLCTSLHSFLGFLTGLHYKMSGITVLYRPLEGMGQSPEDLVRSEPEKVKRLERVVVHWIGSIRDCLSDKQQLVPKELMCPPDEYDFWLYRCEVLQGLHIQMNHPDFRHIMDTMKSAQSIYVKHITELTDEMDLELKKSINNLKYLELLVEPCKTMNQCESPTDIPKCLIRIMHLIRVIWEHSDYLNNTESITGLFTYLSNQVIAFCCKKIDVDVILNGQPRFRIRIANMAIDCCLAYKLLYEMISDEHRLRNPTLGWDLDVAPIFNQIDAFIQRLNDLIEMCEQIIVFGRIDETHVIPKPLFGGSRGPEFERVCDEVERKFGNGLQSVRNIGDHLLNVHSNEWETLGVKYQSLIKELEEILINLFSNIFLSVSNVEEALAALCALYYYSMRKKLNNSFVQNAAKVWLMFAEEIEITNKEVLERSSDRPRPEWLPKFAGYAILLKVNIDRMTRLRAMLDKAEWLPEVSGSIKPIQDYDQMMLNLNRNLRDVYGEWLDTMDSNISSILNRSLLFRSVTMPGMLECNIDARVFEICEECRYFEMLALPIPPHINHIYSKYDLLRKCYDKVVTVILDYNRIVTMLSPKERLLFRALIRECDKKIIPGIVKLTWGSEMTDQYIADCVKHSAKLQSFVDNYKIANASIVEQCERICDLPLITIDCNAPMELDDFMEMAEERRRQNVLEMVGCYNTVTDMIVVVYEGFADHMETTSDQWILYMKKLDDLMRAACLASAINSMEKIYTTLHGDGIVGPSPILCTEIDLEGTDLFFTPTIEEMSDYIRELFTNLQKSFRNFSRLCTKFRLPIPDELPMFFELVANNGDCRKIQATILEELQRNADFITEYLTMWEPFEYLWKLDKTVFMSKYTSENIVASEMDAIVGRYIETSVEVSSQQTSTIVNLFVVDATKLKKSIAVHIEEWKRLHFDVLKGNAYNLIEDYYFYTKSNAAEILKIPQNIPDMQISIDLYRKLRSEIVDQESKFPSMKQHFAVLDKFEVLITSGMRTKSTGIDEQWVWYLERLEEAEEMLDNCKDNFKMGLFEDSKRLQNDAKELLDSFKTLPVSPETSPKDALQHLAAIRAELKKLMDEQAQIQHDLAVFGINVGDNRDLQKLEEELAVYEEVWMLASQWEDAWLEYKTGNFWTIDVDEMESFAFELFKNLTRLCKTLKDREWDILEATRKQVDEFRRTLPLLFTLKNPCMRQRHWDNVRKLVEIEFDEKSDEFNLESIIEMNFQKYAEEIMDISNAATMELQVENGINAIAEVWETMSIELQYFKDGIYRIKNTDDCFQALEDHTVQISSMKSTRFFEPFAVQVEYYEKAISYIAESLEQCLIVQRQWLYLENIFTGDDIRKQLPQEARKFEGLTDEWREITSTLFKSGPILLGTHYKPPNYLLDKLINMNECLELIQRALEVYLETKRQLFPRFYFISNDDLLEILGNANKPEAIQPYFKKLFDNIYKLKINKSGTVKSVRWEGQGMTSDDGEFVKFIDFITLLGPAEIWLARIEKAMRIALKEGLYNTRQSLKKMISKRDKWLELWPGQLCITSANIQWTTDCTRSLLHCKILDEKLPLKRLRKKQNVVLAKLSEMSRRKLTKQLRLKVNTLITIEIHSRDVIDKMYKLNCRDVSHFEWFSQLRFYWERKHNDCCIRQTNTEYWYNYEYTGNSGRLVITPLTDRCYITLTTALHLYRGGSPKGPAGTGKTETVKDLGKALGMWVIVNNCSDGLDYKSMGKCFSGLAQTGAWGCFDEFNRINIEVLSVVAQQILLIFTALQQKKKRLLFEGQEIGLISTIGLFITMNPGYAGRTELPDNLKSMFRPISMIVPDNIIIAENLLFSDGFQRAKILARKVFTLYELAKKQLSKQHHYDFGLRSMVALLRYAGVKRQLFSDQSEDKIVYLAMKDMNIAKLTSDDLPLFEGIMSDIFPGVTTPVVDYADFLVSIKTVLTEMGLQTIPSAVTKVIQLYETKNSRHSVMVLGNTGTAKSTTWQALKGTFCAMKKAGQPNWVDALEYPINPKSLNMAELYGEYNLSTGEWLDGVLSAIMRTICSMESLDQKWMLFDGPVDAVWIENMNSVMDDNKVLTLVNSERITMPAQVSLLFEVGDLSVASPATVSRCGMVYNDYKDWGWRPFMDSWLQKHKSKDYVKMLNELLNDFMDPVLNFKRLNCKETIPMNELNLIQSFCRLMDCLATRENGINPNNLEQLETMSKLWFLFCLVWSICATVDDAGRFRMDGYIRELDSSFPLKDTIYDYYVAVEQQTFVGWENKLSDSWKYQQDMPFYKIIVPTVDTIRYDFLVSRLLAQQYPVLLVGPVGTGKSSTALSVLSTLNSTKYSLLLINMSAQTTSSNVQDTIEGRTEKRTKGVYVPLGGKTMCCFMDDFNMPAKEVYGSQPALELIRQWIDYGFWYDRLKQFRTYVKQVLLLAAMGPAGGGRQVVSPRTLSRFNVINMPFPSNDIVFRIFGTLLEQKFEPFAAEVRSIWKILTKSTIFMYTAVSNRMLPTPAKIHYLFNLRDISRVFQGLLRSSSDYHVTKTSILRLWVHECFRVFHDRLIDDPDTEWFIEQVNLTLGKFFDVSFHNVCPSKQSPVFGDFINLTYEDFSDQDALRTYMITQLTDYNSLAGVVPMDLVLFKEAIEHITRIIRVISQPRGNMLLIGIGGSGRQSLSRLATHICDFAIYRIEVSKNYRTPEFREDLKGLYDMVGVKNRLTTFLFNDTQVAEENFMEILNNMLSVGEVANLYKPDEFEDIKTALEKAAHKANISPTTEAMYSFFIERSKGNLHIILCMSPIGDDFRTRIRQYPALVNCTTIDWFREWPETALLEVATKYLLECKLDVAATVREDNERLRNSLVQTTEDRLRIAISSTFASIHTSVSKMSDIMYSELKRHNYVTPTNYLELVAGFKKMLYQKRDQISGQANKLRNGLWKIDDTKEKVEGMSQDLILSQEQVVQFQAECDVFLIQIEKETVQVDATKVEVEEQSQRIGLEEIDCKKLLQEASKDLAKAMPALDEATKALDALNKKDLTEVKSYAKPPIKVQKVMEAVMILQGRSPTWTEAKRQLGEQDFLDQLRNFDKDHIPDKTLKKIAAYTQDPELEPEKVGVVSLACKSLCKWVRAIERYGKIYKVVGPKIELHNNAIASLKLKQEQLAQAQAKLAELAAKLKKLQDEFDEKTKLKEELMRKAEMLKKKLERAIMLVDGLSGERGRWMETVKRLDKDFENLPGDCLITTAFISYLGPFVTVYREKLTQQWRKEIATKQIPHTTDFQIWKFMSDPTTIREWNIQGLPSDDFSTENGIIVTEGSRWPLIIDPQCQALNWIKNMERDNDLQIIDFGQKDYVKTLEKALQAGKPVLLENVMEVLDPTLGPILNRDIVQQGGKCMIKFNEKYLEYNEKFRFFATTKLSNPHYPPEISTKTTLVNFAVKEDGLQDQLLGIVVRKERPSLEEQKNTLVVNIARNKRTLIDLENEILRMLNESRGSLLEDDELFSTLQTSKKTSASVTESLAIAEVTEIEIDTAREAYQPSAKRAAILFFVLMDMSRIDPMYQFSLQAYIDLFVQSIQRSAKNPDVKERIQNLNEYHSYAVYRNTCRGLFEMHKLLFSFHMCVKILDAAGMLSMAEYSFLLKGGIVLDRQEQIANPCPTWITDATWDNITELDKLPGFHGITDSFEEDQKDWHAWYTTVEPEQLDLIGDWNDICNSFQKILVVRCLRSDRITSCVRSFISNNLGPKYVEPPVLDVKAVLDESTSITPLIFVLSPGVDPTASLLQLAESSNMAKRFESLSLGQGQAPIATKMIWTGCQEGKWIFLANCHLSLSWMPDLDKIVEMIRSKKVHRSFRLWLSSSPHPDFPISILQAGIKMTTEPPKGIKANLQRLYNNITEDQFALCRAKEKYRKLLFSLCFFHAVLLERKKFQQLGWNIVYSFNDSDFEVSENLLSIYLDEYPETPWDALKYLIAGVNYGGHVTDDWDRRLLTTYIKQFFCEDVLKTPLYKLSSLSTYYIPRDGALESYIDYIYLLPNVDRPEYFGQHPNADIASLISETRLLFETLLSLQVQSSDQSGESAEDKVSQLAIDIQSKIPHPIDYENTSKLIGAVKKPLDVVLLQEIERYNALLNSMSKGLDELQKGIKGLVVMSTELEDIFNAMLEGRVPGVWLAAYASLKPLGSWTRDLVFRLDHFSKWAETTHPPILFWLAAFTFPSGFLTAVLQTSARLHEVPIDTLGWEFIVFKGGQDERPKEHPSDGGVYVRGLYLEGGAWNVNGHCLKEPLPMELVCSMPSIHFKPIEAKRKSRRLYECPCYYFPQRSGSFVIAVDLRAGEVVADFWIKRGTALMLSLAT